MRCDIEIILGVVEEAAPARDVRRKAEAEERQRRLGDDRARDLDGAGDDDRAERIGQDMVHDLAQSMAPSARAASTNSFSRSEKNCARTSRATGIQLKPPITATIRTKVPTCGPTSFASEVANR